ncbi:MAG: hypothetical protein JSR60_18620 [Proteobacteria bacterium]|nr:hypothetical protein [Pseudomonadota bacterium]
MASSATPSSGRAWTVVAVAAGVFVLALASGAPAGATAVIGLALVVTVIGAVFKIGHRPAVPLPDTRDVPVTLCVPALRETPSLVEARAAVPEYCLALLRR